jgi:hypothetical protein
MARPQKEGLEYFPHDVHASNDEKLEPLIMLYGAAGYAFYFMHLEYIYRNNELSFDISDAETIQVFCSKLQITQEQYQKILNSAIKLKCFNKEVYESEKKLTSNGIKKRASTITEKREKERLRYEEFKTKK